MTISNDNKDKWISDIKQGELDFITDDKIDYIYNNATGLLKEIGEGNKTINTRVTLLLSYLSMLVAISGNLIFYADLVIIKIICSLLVIEYILVIFYVATKLLHPKLRLPINTEPKNLLISSVIKSEIKLIKFTQCENLQERIEKNLECQLEKAERFKISILITFFAPIVAIAIATISYGVLFNNWSCLVYCWPF